MSNLKINKDTFDLVAKFGSIQPAIIFEKKDDHLLVNRTNTSSTIAYRIKIPLEHFTFNGDEISFADFPEFFGLFKTLTSPEVTQQKERNHEVLILKDGKSRIKYLISDSESIKKGHKVSWNKSDVALKISSSDLKHLKKMIGTLNCDVVKFSSKKDTDVVDISITRGPNDNSFEDQFPSESTADKNVSLSIEADFFQLLPDADYLIEIDNEGIIRASFETESGVEVELFTGEVEEG